MGSGRKPRHDSPAQVIPPCSPPCVDVSRRHRHDPKTFSLPPKSRMSKIGRGRSEVCRSPNGLVHDRNAVSMYQSASIVLINPIMLTPNNCPKSPQDKEKSNNLSPSPLYSSQNFLKDALLRLMLFCGTTKTTEKSRRDRRWPEM